jgi:catechol 2,3-dioxygenase-like lactoylglutathione lyase family enzyme
MEHKIKSVRPFIGAKNFDLSRNFYRDLGFEEIVLSNNMSVFKIGNFAFYLQDAYVKDWIDNTMVFLEVENVSLFWDQLSSLELTSKYDNIKLSPIKKESWGAECFIHDPSGVLWHVGEFYN